MGFVRSLPFTLYESVIKIEKGPGNQTPLPFSLYLLRIRHQKKKGPGNQTPSLFTLYPFQTHHHNGKATGYHPFTLFTLPFTKS